MVFFVSTTSSRTVVKNSFASESRRTPQKNDKNGILNGRRKNVFRGIVPQFPRHTVLIAESKTERKQRTRKSYKCMIIIKL